MTTIEFKVVSFEIKRSGVFDLDKLYKGMRKWFKDRKYKFHEKVHKFKPPELELEWEGNRKETGYRKVRTVMQFHSWYHKEVKVKKDGHEKNMVDARFQIILTTYVSYDYKNAFDSPFKQFLQKFMHKFILFYYIYIIWPDRAYYELVDLQNKIREFIDSSIKGGAF